MGILRAIRDYFVTDIEVVLSTGDGAEYDFRESSTVDGGALSRTVTDSEMRIVFHGRAGLPGRGTFVRFGLKDGHELTIRRVPFARVEMLMTPQGQPETVVARKIVVPDLGSLILFRDPYGNTGTVRRMRHRDYQLFPTTEAKP